MSSSTNIESYKFELLQIFRGWAALLVILVHASAIVSTQHHSDFMGGFFLMGNAGVDFFFVLSGFLIFHIHRNDFGNPARLGIYAWKRLSRIFPVYWVVSLAILPVYFYVSKYGQGDETDPWVIFNSLFLLPMARSPMLVAGWSLRHELLFYFWFALLIGLNRRWSIPIITLWVVGVIVSVILSIGSAHRFTNPVMHLLWWPQNFEFIIGCAAAFIMPKLSVAIFTRSVCLSLMFFGVIAFLATGFFTGPLLDLARSEHVLCFGLISFVIIVTSTLLEYRHSLTVFWRNKPPFRFFCYLGTASYSIYLVHGPILSVLFKVAGAYNLIPVYGGNWVTASIFIITIAVGCLFHAMVERPMMGFLTRNRPKPLGSRFG